MTAYLFCDVVSQPQEQAVFAAFSGQSTQTHDSRGPTAVALSDEAERKVAISLYDLTCNWRKALDVAEYNDASLTEPE